MHSYNIQQIITKIVVRNKNEKDRCNSCPYEAHIPVEESGKNVFE